MSVISFEFLTFGINNTRAVHEDTDYFAMGLVVGTQAPLVVTHKIGNVNNGIHNVGLTVGPVEIGQNDPVTFSYLITNHGGAKSDTVLTACAAAITKTPLSTFNAPGTNLVPSTNGLSAKDNMLAWWVAIRSAFAGVSTNHCDGPVVIDQFSLQGSALEGLAAQSNVAPFSSTYLGIDSAIGCGSDSDYGVTWKINVGLDRIPPRGPLK
jgi:hypothetical protein